MSDPNSNPKQLPQPVDDERKEKRAGKLLEIGRDCAAHLKEQFRSADHAELLYDENGLPKR